MKHSNHKESKLNARYIGMNRNKFVKQFTKDGLPITTFTSMFVAAEQTGIRLQLISLCCCRKRNTAGGFIWRLA